MKSTNDHLFRVYFRIYPHVPAASFRYVWAESLEHARDLVDTEIRSHQSTFDKHGFHLVRIQEEELLLFGDLARSLSF